MSGGTTSQEPELLVERLRGFTDDDLGSLCEATDAAIIDGGGFGWVTPPGRRALENYFKGVLLVPERELFVARLTGDIVGSAILVRPPRNNEAQAFAARSSDVLARRVFEPQVEGFEHFLESVVHHLPSLLRSQPIQRGSRGDS